MDIQIIKLLYATSVVTTVLLGSILVDSYSRLSRVLRVFGYAVIPLIFILTGALKLLDYQLILTLTTMVVAIAISLHSEAYYRVLYGVSRYTQVIIDVILTSLILLFSSTFFIEVLVYWFLLDIVVAFIAITMEEGSRNLPVASTYIIMCIAPSDLALLTMWALLALNHGVYESLLLNISELATPIRLDLPLSLILTVGFASKIGQFPLHSWPPIVYGRAPSHVSAILSGVVSKIGIYALFLVNQLFQLDPIALYVLLAQGLISTVYGSFSAVLQTHIKYLLAYSSVSYGGIIVTLYTLHTLWSLEMFKVLVFIVVVFHVLTKTLGFLNTGLVYQVANTYDVYKLGYLHYLSRRATLAAYMTLMNLTGMPPSIGFFVKLLVLSMLILYSNISLIIPVSVAIVVSFILSIAYSAKFMSIYTSTLPRITPRPVTIPGVETASEIYLGVATMLTPIPLFIYAVNSSSQLASIMWLLVPVYIAALIAYIVLFTRVYRRIEVSEDIKYWLSGVEL